MPAAIRSRRNGMKTVRGLAKHADRLLHLLQFEAGEFLLHIGVDTAPSFYYPPDLPFSGNETDVQLTFALLKVRDLFLDLQKWVRFNKLLQHVNDVFAGRRPGNA